MIKAIETKYKGYRFRSRLEARWAVYFDSLGLEWEYEPEGFELPSGRYLPDFYLPQVNLWCEVKPRELSSDELRKVYDLVFASKKGCILLVGIPACKPYFFIDFEQACEKHFTLDETEGLIHRGDWHLDCMISMHKQYPVCESRFYTCTGGCWEEEDIKSWFPDAEIAVIAARSARFEFNR